MREYDKRRSEHPRRKHPPGGTRGCVLLVAIAASPALAASPGVAQSIGSTDRIAQLEARVVELENRRAAGGLRMSANTMLTFYGYAKADFVYDRRHQLGDTTFGIMGVDTGTPRRSGSNFHARQSRLGFTTRTQTGMGELTTRVEGDFFGSGNAFRLRHAYGEFNGFLAGDAGTGPTGEIPGVAARARRCALPHGAARVARSRHGRGFGPGGQPAGLPDIRRRYRAPTTSAHGSSAS
jgi:hypothetical protein